MRLLKTGPYVSGDERIELIQRWGKDIPAYAILSHTWSANPDDEVLLADVQNGTYDRKPAYSKLRKAMERAMLDGWNWLWVDTCCIDKTSSAELSEAINSMYSYYKNSQMCYAYLADVESETSGAEFDESRWWKRGWTLQEFLAPPVVVFFNRYWRAVGSKRSLHETIAKTTGIEYQYLTGERPLEMASIAKRMSWAACRQTTRDEDIAYSLLGLFDVNMPLLYGEGSVKAFLRLQEEIMKTNEDQSIFAWVSDDRYTDGLHGLLADSPRDFARTGNTLSYTERSDKPSVMTARGVHITVPLTYKSSDCIIAALNCPRPGGNFNDWLAVYLRPLDSLMNRYARIECDKLASVEQRGSLEEIYVHQRFAQAPEHPFQSLTEYFLIRSMQSFSDCKTPHEHRIVAFVGKDVKKAAMSEDQFLREAPPNAEPRPWSSVPLVYRADGGVLNPLSMALRVERMFDEEAFVIMLGTTETTALGIGMMVTDSLALDLGSDWTFSQLDGAFRPQPLGTFVRLKHHRVRVSAQRLVRVEYNQMIYAIDIEIQSFPKLPTASAILNMAIDSISPGQRGVSARTDLRDIVRRQFWSDEKNKPSTQQRQPVRSGRGEAVVEPSPLPDLVPSRFEQSS